MFPAPATTAQYACVFDSNGELLSAVADMAVLERIPASILANDDGHRQQSLPQQQRRLLICDGNLHPDTCMRKIGSQLPSKRSPQIWFDPVSVPKSERYFALPTAHNSAGGNPNTPNCELIAPNFDELQALVRGLAATRALPRASKRGASKVEEKGNSNAKEMLDSYGRTVFDFVLLEQERRKRPAPAVVLTCGDLGCLVTSGATSSNEGTSGTFSELDTAQFRPFASFGATDRVRSFTDRYEVSRHMIKRGRILPDSVENKQSYTGRQEIVVWHVRRRQPLAKIVNCTGAGDTLLGATAFAYAYKNYSLLDAVMVSGEETLYVRGLYNSNTVSFFFLTRKTSFNFVRRKVKLPLYVNH